MNGKGSSPRNNLSQQFRENYNAIEWDGETPVRGHYKFTPKKTIHARPNTKRGHIVFRAHGH
jgi:hypothetical protein